MKMKKIESIGNMPSVLKVFLTNVLSGESDRTEVWDCSYQEIIDKAKEEKLEPQVIIDKKNTGRAFLCAVGASIRTILLYDQPSVKPVMYFAELDEPRKRQFQYELNQARKNVIETHREQLDTQKRIKEAARKGAEELRKNGKTRLDKPNIEGQN